MTTQTHRVTIAAAAVIGALAIAAPASAADQQSSTTPAPTAAHPFSGQGGEQPSTTPTPTSAHPLSGQGDQQVVALRRDGSQAEAFVADVGGTPSATGDGFDWGDAAIGAGVGVLAAALLMGTGAGGGRRTSSRTKPAGAVSQGA
jgi:hypothetical protein